MSTLTGMPDLCREQKVAVDSSGTPLTERLSSKVDQAHLAVAAGLAFASTVHDQPVSLRLDRERLILRPASSAGVGSAIVSEPGAPPPERLLAGLWRDGGPVLAHPWVPGTPHFANGVVVAGRLHLTDCWECGEIEEDNRIRLTSVLNVWPGTTVFELLNKSLQEFVRVARIAWGPVHFEAVVVADGTVRLVKCSPRVAGEPLSTLCRELGTIDQAAALAVGDPAEAIITGRRPAPGYAADYSFIVRRAGRLVAIAGLDELCARPSFRRIWHMPTPGDRLTVADSGESPVATLLLRADEEAVIRSDIAYYQTRNGQGIFQVADEG
ncbi:hypothetical protein E1193_07065 [Micromonospora sp. KC606]|uniref:hypothetical protein n=1 Tax=Micromonospora sp. KC606 TaxID=2530379 RepID=UPI001048AD0B|nr:hypothetical protein [Micromonospora sp. KC606]TDC83975.1 hypothetical protein E1193_07065 [Micromonospora sp. KC606]